jgi:hypothetical protein
MAGYELTYRWAVVYFWRSYGRSDALILGQVVVEGLIHGVPANVTDGRLRKVLKASAHAEKFSSYDHFMANRRVVRHEEVRGDPPHIDVVSPHWDDLQQPESG